MSNIEKRTVSLPADQANYIDTLVESGGYASASEVVRAGLRALQERDAAVDRWLKEEVLPAYDAIQANPERGRTGEQVAARLLAHHLEQKKNRAVAIEVAFTPEAEDDLLGLYD